jgi:curved DNA binding protein
MSKNKLDDGFEDIDSDEEKEETLATPGVIDKYQQAGKIANKVLEQVILKCEAGASVSAICAFGDNLIEQEVKKVFTKNKQMEKGVAFPTCISANNLVGHVSPLVSEDLTINQGDLVKIDLGVHIDGFVGQVAHTIVVGQKEVDGKKAEVVLAAHNAIQAGLRLLKPGKYNHEVTEVIQKCCDAYNVNAVEGVLSHNVAKFFLDGNNTIINKPTYDQNV